ncbi:MAG TPA: response regulator [Longimicrobiales bacterium]|nr:response regulator [Longimicrobiales bacterium]
MARILIVDDDESDRLFERAILEDQGHTLFFAKDGEAALKTYRDSEVDLVVTDLYMPGVNGLRLIKQLKAMDPAVLIIAASGVAKGQLDRALELGAGKVLAKPLDPHALADAVRELLDRSDPWSGLVR